jgi:hypothetical protein
MTTTAKLRAVKTKALAWSIAKHALEDHVNGCVLRGERPDVARQAELTAAYNAAERDLETAVTAGE